MRAASCCVLVAFMLAYATGCPGQKAPEPGFISVDSTDSGGGEPPATDQARAGRDWPRFLGPDGTSVSTEKGIITPWPKEGLRIVWQRQLGTGYGAPAIQNGKLYIFDRVIEKTATSKRDTKLARLSCVDARSGKEHWSFTYPTAYKDSYGYNNGPRCCPVLDGDRVYLYGVEGMLHCLDAANRQTIWKVDTQKEFGVVQNFFGVGGTPVIDGDLLIVLVGGSPPAAIRASSSSSRATAAPSSPSTS